MYTEPWGNSFKKAGQELSRHFKGQIVRTKISRWLLMEIRLTSPILCSTYDLKYYASYFRILTLWAQQLIPVFENIVLSLILILLFFHIIDALNWGKLNTHINVFFLTDICENNSARTTTKICTNVKGS